MPCPNFLVIGAAKAGTTALYKYLKQHPKVFMSTVKEPYFFAYEGARLEDCFRGPGDWSVAQYVVTRWEDYLELFSAAPAAAAAIGDASVVYLQSPDAPARIRHYTPEARLVAVLRQPADRAFSHYLMLRRDGRETVGNFREALRREDERVRLGWGPGWQYRRSGFYAAGVERYQALFGREQLRIYLYDEWQADNLSVLRDIFRFLEIDETFTPDLRRRHNVGGLPRSQAWHAFLHQPHPLKDLVRPLFPKPLADRLWLRLRDINLVHDSLDPALRAELTEEFRPDILRLQDLIQRDLSHWLEA